MVTADVDRGAEVVAGLDRAGIRVAVALWTFLSDYEDWRLVLSSRRFDASATRDAYRLLHSSLEPGGFTPKNTPPIMIFPMSDPFIKELRRMFAGAKSVEGMRLGGQMIGGRFVEDAYVYRIS